jgi:hypothetical protein
MRGSEPLFGKSMPPNVTSLEQAGKEGADALGGKAGPGNG